MDAKPNKGGGGSPLSFTEKDLIEAKRDGMTRRQASDHYGVSYPTVCNGIRKWGHALPRDNKNMNRSPAVEAANWIWLSRAQGKPFSCSVIGNEVGMSRQGVRLIAEKIDRIITKFDLF